MKYIKLVIAILSNPQIRMAGFFLMELAKASKDGYSAAEKKALKKQLKDLIDALV